MNTKLGLVANNVRCFMSLLTLILLMSACAYTVKPTKPIPLDPRVFNSMATQTEIRAIHFVPRPEIALRFTSKAPEKLPVEDPLILVEEKFVDALKKRIPVLNINRIPQSRLNNNLVQLKRTYKRGLVISFHTTDWALDPYWDDKKLYHHIKYSVIARLIRVETEEILWLRECRVTNEDPLGKMTTYYDYQLNDYALLKVKRREVLKQCADELLNNFLGI